MRLINVETLRLEEYASHDPPPYAILSHTWGDREVTLKDFESGVWRSMEWQGGRSKITECCAIAASEGFGYIWVDTCCIDKSSSAELSEAINSMFRWYQDSGICYAYLSDVNNTQDPEVEGSDFCRSRWFTRGWTLQELLAPTEVVFLGSDWSEIGTKRTLQSLIQKITRITGEALADSSWDKYSIAQKMSWAAGRRTRRLEDEAYCLLGLFDINIPLLYGEGHRSFFRLQEEIMKRSDDESIFAWGIPSDLQSHVQRSGMLAPSPSFFKDASEISVLDKEEEYNQYTGMNTLDEDAPNTFELFRQLVRLRMVVIGPLQALELVAVKSNMEEPQAVARFVEEIVDMSSLAEGVDGSPPRTQLRLDPGDDDGNTIDLLSISDTKHDDMEPPSLTISDLSNRSTRVSDNTGRASTWFWYIYEPVIVVPLMCAIEGRRLGLLLTRDSSGSKQAGTMYRLHRPSLVCFEGRPGSLSSSQSRSLLYVHGIRRFDPNEQAIKLVGEKPSELRISKLLDMGYSFVGEQRSDWSFVKAEGKLIIPSHFEARPQLLLFQHGSNDHIMHPSFFIQINFRDRVILIGAMQGSSLPPVRSRVTWRVSMDGGSHAQVSIPGTERSIMLRWRETRTLQFLSVTVEDVRFGLRGAAVAQSSCGQIAIRLQNLEGLGRRC